MSTADEIQLQFDHYNRIIILPLREKLEHFTNALLINWLDVYNRYNREEEMQLQRMTDDGCPLGD